MTSAPPILESFLSASHRWLVTGVAGFIGSHLLEALLRHDQFVTGLDSLLTGHERNLEEVRRRVAPAQWHRFEFRRGDVTDIRDVAPAVKGAQWVLHQAGLTAVQQSLDDPQSTHAANVTGFLNVLTSAREAGVQRMIYASSSAVYGDCQELPARENQIGRPLSPYGLSKWICEQYADVFRRCYGMESIGLRYFNVFGPRQDPDAAYAAVVPRWTNALLDGRSIEIHGDGEIRRDFCHVDNVVEANLLAAATPLPADEGRVFNVALGVDTSLNQLLAGLVNEVRRVRPESAAPILEHRPARPGDVRVSRADVGRLRQWCGYRGATNVATGLAETVRWFATRGDLEPAAFGRQNDRWPLKTDKPSPLTP